MKLSRHYSKTDKNSNMIIFDDMEQELWFWLKYVNSMHGIGDVSVRMRFKIFIDSLQYFLKGDYDKDFDDASWSYYNHSYTVYDPYDLVYKKLFDPAVKEFQDWCRKSNYEKDSYFRSGLLEDIKKAGNSGAL